VKPISGDDFDQAFNPEADPLSPKPTTYDGIRYRSRLEARWAAFYDALGVTHQYERQHFNLGDGIFYLPDFWLPMIGARGVWVEIKPFEPLPAEIEKACRLAVQTALPVYLFFGWVSHSVQYDLGSAYKFYIDQGWGGGYRWSECPHCGELGVTPGGFAEQIVCTHAIENRNVYSAETPRLQAAYMHAQQVQFNDT
jgi:hypothetical protein